MPRYLRSRKTGRIIPWNEHRISHPDLYEWEGDPLNPDSDPAAKAASMPKTRKRRVVKKETPPVEVQEHKTDSLLKGLIGD